MSRLGGIRECPDLGQSISVQLTPEKKIPCLVTAQCLLVSCRTLEQLLEFGLVGGGDEAQAHIGDLATAASFWLRRGLGAAAEGGSDVVGRHARRLRNLRLGWLERAIVLLLLAWVPGLLRLLLLRNRRRLEAGLLRLLKALVLLLLLLQRISSRLGLKTASRVSSVLLLQWLLLLLLLLTESCRLLRLERRWLALESSRLRL